MKKVFYVSILILIAIIGLTACDLFDCGCNDDDPTKATVYFYDCSSGSPVLMKKAKITKGESLSLTSKEVPSKRGYTLVDSKWYTDKSFSNAYNFGEAINENIDLYAKKYEPNKYNVKFDMNVKSGASVTGIPKTMNNCEYDKSYDITFTAEPVYAGHEFLSWNTNKDGYGTKISKNGPFKNLAEGGDVTLYAQWKYEGIVVTYKDPNTNKVLKEDEITDAGGKTTATGYTPVEKKGYTITGWEDPSGNAFDFTKGIESSITLYAKWTPITYTIVYDINKPLEASYANGISVSNVNTFWNSGRSDKTAKYDEKVKLADLYRGTTKFYEITDADGKWHYDHIGWSNLKASITADYENDTVEVKDLVELANDEGLKENKIIMYAVWKSDKPKSSTTSGLAQLITLVISHNGCPDLKIYTDSTRTGTPGASLGSIQYTGSALSDFGVLQKLRNLCCYNTIDYSTDYYLDGFYVETDFKTKVLDANLDIYIDQNGTKGYVGYENGKKVWLRHTNDDIKVYAKWVKK